MSSRSENILPQSQHVGQVSVQAVRGEEDPLLKSILCGMVGGDMGTDRQTTRVQVTLLSKLTMVQITSTHSGIDNTQLIHSSEVKSRNELPLWCVLY